MKKEHYTIQVGKCGIQLGHEYWKYVCSELLINPNGSSHIEIKKKQQRNEQNVFFNENSSGKLIPRAILFDLEPRSLNRLEKSTFCEFYSKDNIVTDKQSAGNNWAHGYIKASEHKSELENILRKNIESCDRMPAFGIFHSLVGGTGSGSGSYILEIIKDEFLGKFITSYSIIPNQKQSSDIVVQPYNLILAIRWLTLYCDSVIFFENNAMERIISIQDENTKISLARVNSLIAKIIAKINTAIFCSPVFTDDIENIILPLIPIPNLHFLSAGISNHMIRGKRKYFSVESNNNSIKNTISNRTTSISFESGKLISAFHLLKQSFTSTNIFDDIEKSYRENKINFIDWAPPAIHYLNSTDFSQKERKGQSDMCLFNHTSVKNTLTEILTHYDLLRKRNAFLNNYLKEFDFQNGLKIFENARETILSVIEEYNKADTNHFP
jgi:tubulin gamma